VGADLALLGKVAGALLGSGLVATLVRAWLDRRPKRIAAIRQLCFHLQRLEKQMSIARDFPGVQLWAFTALISEFHAVVLSNENGVLWKREYAAVSDALETCVEEADYIAGQIGSDAHRHRQEMSDSARRALAKIQFARHILKDSKPLYWPADPKNRELWDVNALIPR
jgi:hypothetical protein